MFRKRDEPKTDLPAPSARVTSVLGTGIAWKGAIHGSGGVRIEGAFDGEIALKGLLVISETGRITCPHILANTVIVSGAVQGNITAEKVEIRSTGRVWGDVVTSAFSTEEGAFLRGQIQMEDKIDIQIPQDPTNEQEVENQTKPENNQPEEAQEH